MKLYTKLARTLCAIRNCERAGNSEWQTRHTETVRSLVRDHLPSGSGFDLGTELDLDRSTRNRLVFSTEFHHMDDFGGYCGWTAHQVIVTADLVFGVNIRATGRNFRSIKDYIEDAFSSALDAEVTE